MDRSISQSKPEWLDVICVEFMDGRDAYRATNLAPQVASLTESERLMVATKLLRWLLIDPNNGVIRFADARGKCLLHRLAHLYDKFLSGERLPTRTQRAMRKELGDAHWANSGASWAAWTGWSALMALTDPEWVGSTIRFGGYASAFADSNASSYTSTVFDKLMTLIAEEYAQ